MPFSSVFLVSAAFSLASFREVEGYEPREISFSFPRKWYFSRQLFVPLGVMSRYSPLPSKSFLCLFSGFRGADSGVGQGHGVILLCGFSYPDAYSKIWGMFMYVLKFHWMLK